MRFPERQRGPVTLRRGQVKPGTTVTHMLDAARQRERAADALVHDAH